MAALAEHRTSQRTQTSQHPGQPIAMSEKSSNFAVAFGDAPHVHRTFIALPSHTRACVAAMSPAGVPVALRSVPIVPCASRVPDGCRKKFCKILRNFVFNYEQDSQDYSRLFFILDNEK